MNQAGIVMMHNAEFMNRKLNRPIRTILHTGKFLSLIKEGQWEYVDRVNATGVAIILGVTAEDKILLVEQYRIPVHARTIELPAGIIGDQAGCSNESQAEAARRELLEETGYAADNFVSLMTGPSCSGLTSERVTLFRAWGCVALGKVVVWPTKKSPSMKFRWLKW